MRRYSLMLPVFALAALLMVGLAWAEETKTSQKSTTTTAAGCPKKYAAEKVCAKTEGLSSEKACTKFEGLSSVDAGKHCADMKGASGTGGCHRSGGGAGMKGFHSWCGDQMMMICGPGSCMKDMHPGMMGRGGWSGRGRGHGMGRGFNRSGGPEHLIRMAERLELTEKQVEDLKALKRDHEKSTIEMRAEIETAHVDLKQLLDQETLDFGKIKAKVSQIADMQKKMQLTRWTLAEKSHDLLTAEQREKAKSFRRDRGGMMKGRRQMIKKVIIEEDED